MNQIQNLLLFVFWVLDFLVDINILENTPSIFKVEMTTLKTKIVFSSEILIIDPQHYTPEGQH